VQQARLQLLANLGVALHHEHHLAHRNRFGRRCARQGQGEGEGRPVIELRLDRHTATLKLDDGLDDLRILLLLGAHVPGVAVEQQLGEAFDGRERRPWW
jgi:hypothetical protein